ncbi:unnamed protein product [Parnassius mnemosyne]|uniref:MADF domain-containing protein n=1 Tax=Parnassius mnemosyne TaxID=213953 RepID=A0AAV1L4W8_9NEOP
MSEDKAKTLQFIRDYKNHQVLWDSRHKDYNNKKKRIVALTDLGIKYNMNLRFIKNKIKSLRSYFSKEYQKVARKTEGERYRSSWFAYKHLLFLLNASPKKLRIDEQVENSDESCDDDGESQEKTAVAACSAKKYSGGKAFN